MTIDRRSLLKYAGFVPWLGQIPHLSWVAAHDTAEKSDYTVHIGTALVELAPDHIVSTTVYNGQFPGPLLRPNRRTRQKNASRNRQHQTTREESPHGITFLKQARFKRRKHFSHPRAP